MLLAHLSEGFLYVAAENTLAAIIIITLVVAELITEWDSEGRQSREQSAGADHWGPSHLILGAE